jgi:hypothetical protein
MTTDRSAFPAKSKVMRVATTLIGATAFMAGFAPAVTAHAEGKAQQPTPQQPAREQASRAEGRMVVRLALEASLTPDNTPPAQPYSLAVGVSNQVQSFHVCGFHPTNDWRCTRTYKNPGYNLGYPQYNIFNIGGNYRSWDRGTIDVYWNKGGPGSWDTCNTNSNFSGYLLSPNSVLLGTIGFGHGTC